MGMRFRVVIDKERCKGCMLCVAACPKTVLRRAKGINARGQYHSEVGNAEACIGCKQCAEICPDMAITIAKLAEDSSEQRASTAKPRSAAATREET